MSNAQNLQNPFLNVDDSNESGFVVGDNAGFAQPASVDFSAQQNQNILPPPSTNDEEKQPDDTKVPAEGEEQQEYHWYQFYKPEFYSRWFNVETSDVLKRMFWGLIPFFGNFFKQTETNPDLYGTIWIPMTVIFVTFFSGSLGSMIRNKVDYQKLTIITGTILVYIIFIPIILWAVCRFAYKVKNSLVSYYCLFGYAYIVYVVVIPLCAIPFWYVQIPLVCVGCALMSLTVFKNLFQLLWENTKKLYVIITLAVLLVINLVVAAILIVCFYYYLIVCGMESSLTCSTQSGQISINFLKKLILTFISIKCYSNVF
ncbi:protein YIPF2, putative [Entamoeba invadens IP1]|uniref:Protein YIPF n=1 Tax=Entamoeba invadens IP1 TaxID=370355 RepID=A0A0A1U848_ENTIV|nr:protein YIPF2, putative [Entamoeba invadens IP1]ELP88148.1 protein YIPF2, putative [Entamoeba invadens IP1]|eukprot:XP_004254919.1 protein YIPF2, putative [Entamoeba invadens IP1]